eukprot:scaffold1918_cov227-Chaetoceros_neogracile.AAC.9
MANKWQNTQLKKHCLFCCSQRETEITCFISVSNSVIGGHRTRKKKVWGLELEESSSLDEYFPWAVTDMSTFVGTYHTIH